MATLQTSPTLHLVAATMWLRRRQALAQSEAACAHRAHGRARDASRADERHFLVSSPFAAPERYLCVCVYGGMCRGQGLGSCPRVAHAQLAARGLRRLAWTEDLC